MTNLGRVWPFSGVLLRSIALTALVLGSTALKSFSADDTNWFPILPWNNPPADPAVLKKIHDCGFTLAGFVPPAALSLCRAAGLKAIVSDPRASDYDWAMVDETKARSNVSNLVAQVGSDPTLFGYYLRDEPPAAYFAGLAKIAGAVRDFAPGKWPYINLLPDYAEKNQLGTDSYAAYVEQFIANCHPTIVSYDNYSLMDNGTVRDNYWSNLEAISAACRRHSIHFWNIVLSVAHFSYREPSAADLRFEAYTSLAYGARGLAWFTYFAPPVGGYRAAPIDQFGNETPTWQAMQNVNLQVQKLGPTLLALKLDDVYHIGTLPAGAHDPSTNSLISSVDGKNFLVGDFTHSDGSRYALVVNKDLNKSRPCAPAFRKPPKRLLHVSPYSGQLTPFEGEYVWLAPGQGVLLKIE
jgi:hypothetical protein